MDRVRSVVNYGEREQATYTGKGVYVAVLDSGVASHPDLKDRVIAFRDFTGGHRSGYYDDHGHGTHV